MKIFWFASFLIVFIVGATLGQSKYTLEKSSSKIDWWGYKLFRSDATSHNGTTRFDKGKLVLDAKNQLKEASFTADIESIDCEDLKKNAKDKAKLESHLKSADFFNVGKFPTASFVLKSVTTSGDKKFPLKLTGDLTIKEITKPVSFKAKKEIKGKEMRLESEKFMINRKDFKVEYEANYKDVVIKNDIDLKVLITAKK